MRKQLDRYLYMLLLIATVFFLLYMVLDSVFNAPERIRAAELKIELKIARQLQLKQGDAAEFTFGDRMYKAVITDIAATPFERPMAKQTFHLRVNFRKMAVIAPQGGSPDAHDDNSASLDDNS